LAVVAPATHRVRPPQPGRSSGLVAARHGKRRKAEILTTKFRFEGECNGARRRLRTGFRLAAREADATGSAGRAKEFLT